MIKHLKILLKVEENNFKPSYKWGYQLYGYICDILEKEIVEELHLMQITPLSQYLVKTDIENQFEWNIFLFGDKLDGVSKEINEGDVIKITKYNTSFCVVSKFEDIICQKEYCKRYLVNQNFNNIKKLKFLTPCSFKSNGEYMIFPSSNFILNSAISKWNNFFDKYAIKDDEAIEQILNSCKIVKYSLKSTSYSLKEVNIPGFIGEVTLKFSGPKRIVDLDNMLTDFLQYSGVGIKTALGMGACKIIN